LDGEKIDVKGRIVFIGTSAPGLGDLRSTPNQAVIPGVEIHAQAVEQILAHDFLVRSPWSNEIEITALIMMGMWMIWLLPRVGPLGCATLGALVIGLAGLGAVFSYQEYGLLFDPVYPGSATFLVYVTGLLLSYQRSDVERKRVRDAFGHYLAPELVERLAADASHLKLGGEIRDISLLFLDVRDFTSIAETMDAQQVTALLNRFLTPMTEAVLKHEGTIDKYIGDSIMAFWNAPLDDPQHARHAFDTALEMRQRLAELNVELMAQHAGDAGFQPIRIGIGLNTGPCCVGNLGSAQRFNYSAMGDDVNLASRIEGVTKIYGLDILIAQSTRELAPDYATVEIGDVRVKGKAAAVRLHALIGPPDLAGHPNYPALAQAIGRVASAIRSADAHEAERALQVARALAPGLGIDALLGHMSATIEGMLRQRGGQPTTMAAALP
jgi:adenylate cyclase